MADRRVSGIAAAAVVIVALGWPMAGAIAQKVRETPYWASISAAKARLRTGPGNNFPALWEYVRPDLPLKVVQVRAEWRKVEDPDGAQGWMRSFLLSEQRTAIVRGGTQPLRAAPDAGAKILWRAETGVIGRISHCASGWCEFDVRGRAGYIAVDHLWGVAPGETID